MTKSEKEAIEWAIAYCNGHRGSKCSCEKIRIIVGMALKNEKMSTEPYNILSDKECKGENL